MVPDGRTDGMDGRRQNYIPPTSSGDKNVQETFKLSPQNHFITKQFYQLS